MSTEMTSSVGWWWKNGVSRDNPFSREQVDEISSSIGLRLLGSARGNPRKGTAIFVNKLKAQSGGHRELFRFVPPLPDDTGKSYSYVVVSSILSSFDNREPETFFFPADKHGVVREGGRGVPFVFTSQTGYADIDRAIREAGYAVRRPSRENPRLSPLERARDKTMRTRGPYVGSDMTDEQWRKFGAKWRADYVKALVAGHGRAGSEDYTPPVDRREAEDVVMAQWMRMKNKKSRSSFIRAVGGSNELDAVTNEKLQHDLNWDALGWDPYLGGEY